MDKNDSSDSDDTASIFPLPLAVCTTDVHTNAHDPSAPVSRPTACGVNDHNYDAASDLSMPGSERTAFEVVTRYFIEHILSNYSSVFIMLEYQLLICFISCLFQ